MAEQKAMKPTMLVLVLACGLAMLTSCATAQRQPAKTTPSSAPPESAAAVDEAIESQEVVITGVLEPTVERGGWILKGEKETLLLLGIAEYRGEEWFQTGSRVKVWGSMSPDTVTTFMQGVPFKVSRIEPVTDS